MMADYRVARGNKMPTENWQSICNYVGVPITYVHMFDGNKMFRSSSLSKWRITTTDPCRGMLLEFH